MWETALGVGDSTSAEPVEGAVEQSAGVVSTERGYVVVLSAGGIHVLQADTGAVLAQWWCEPSREPDLAALVGLDVQVCLLVCRGRHKMTHPLDQFSKLGYSAPSTISCRKAVGEMSPTTPCSGPTPLFDAE